MGAEGRRRQLGVVTALEFGLIPVTHAYAGWLAWDWTFAEPVLQRWAEWTRSAPDEVTTSARILQLPPLPELPEPIRGRQLVAIDGAVLGDPAAAASLLAPLRALDPELDTFATVPTPAVARLDSGSTLAVAELRQLGGAVSRPTVGGATAYFDGARFWQASRVELLLADGDGAGALALAATSSASPTLWGPHGSPDGPCGCWPRPTPPSAPLSRRRAPTPPPPSPSRPASRSHCVAAPSRSRSVARRDVMVAADQVAVGGASSIAVGLLHWTPCA